MTTPRAERDLRIPQLIPHRLLPATKQRPKRLVELGVEELGELLDLAGGADSVELKLTVPESDQATTVTALGLDPLAAQIRQVFFFDTPDLKLDGQGLVVRARRVQGRGDDSVVKLRPVAPNMRVLRFGR